MPCESLKFDRALFGQLVAVFFESQTYSFESVQEKNWYSSIFVFNSKENCE
jgi:hypothetical protein